MRHLGALAAAVVDCELGHDSRDRALAHLAGCLPCRAEVDTQRRIKARMATMDCHPAPATLAARLAAIADSAPAPAPAHPSASAVFRRPVSALPPSAPPRSSRGRRPLSTRPGIRPARGGRRPGRRRLGRTVAAGASAVLLGLGAALALGGGAPSGGQFVDPSLDTLVAAHLATTGEVPLTDSAMAAVSVSFAR